MADSVIDELSNEPRVGACDRCHRRKAKCDRTKPACSSCSKAKIECVYTSREPTIRRQDIEKLERRLHQLEAKNAALTSQLREHQRNPGDVHHHDSEAMDVSTGLPITQHRNSGAGDGGNNEVESQVSYLSLNAGGDRSYVGSASGLLLASLLQSNLHSQNQPDGMEPVSKPDRFGSSSSRRSQGSNPDISTLPRETLARSLVNAYFSHDHLCYPFLHPKSVFAAVDAIYSDSTFYQSHPIDSFHIDMIFAIATAQVYKFDWQVLPDAETHHDRAMTRLSLVLGNGGLPALQATLLICQFRMASSLYDTSASLWHLIGTASRMCIEMGLHRESFYDFPAETLSAPLREAAIEEVEIKRRCFWCVVAMDRIASITLGRPLAIQLDDIDTELPQTGPGAFAMTPDGPLSPTEPLDSPQWHLRTSIFVAIVRYRVICGKILTSLHGIKRPQKYGSMDIRTVRDQLAQELEAWRHDTSSLPLPVADVNSTMPQDRSSFRSREWYDMLYHNGVLMLFRPSPSLSDVTQSSNTLQKLYDASRQSITIYSYLHRSRKINYSWITLHSLFNAGLSYIYAVRSHFQGRRRLQNATAQNQGPDPTACLKEDPTITQVVNETRACSNVLVAVSERWSSARNCYQVFGRLSDAVLNDVVDFQTQARRQHDVTMAVPLATTGPATNSFATPSTYNPDQQAQSLQALQPLMVDSTLQDCFDDLQHFYGDHFGSDAIMHLSQDWMFEIQNMETGAEFYSSTG